VGLSHANIRRFNNPEIVFVAFADADFSAARARLELHPAPRVEKLR
jgi:hypothetical protein